MGLLGAAIAGLLMVATFSAHMFITTESKNDIYNTTFQQDVNLFTDYSNYVRRMLTEHQKNNTSTYNSLKNSLRAGKLVGVSVWSSNACNGCSVIPPYNGQTPDYVNSSFIKLGKVGHAVMKEAPYTDPYSDVKLYVWTVPDEIITQSVGNKPLLQNLQGRQMIFVPEKSFDGMIKREYGNGGQMFYTKSGSELVRSGGAEKVALRADLQKIIPEGAFVFISHPFGKGSL